MPDPVITVKVSPQLDTTSLEKVVATAEKKLGAIKIDSQMVKDVLKATDKIKSGFDKTMGEGFLRFGKDFTDKLQAGAGKFINGMKESTKIMADKEGVLIQLRKEAAKRIDATQDEAVKQRIKEEFDADHKKIKKELDFEKKKFDQNETQYRKTLKRQTRGLERRKKAEQEIEAMQDDYDQFRGQKRTKQARAMAEGFGEGLENALGALQGADVKAFGSMFEGFGDKLKTAGAGMKAEGGSKAKGVLGSALGGFGKALAGIGALVGMMSALVKLFLDADAAYKDMNNDLMQGVGTFDLLNKRSDSLRDAFKDINKATTDWSNNSAWGTLAKEQVAILNAFAQAGYTYREMRAELGKSTDAMAAFHETTKAALATATILGSTPVEVATQMADAMEDFGLDLKGVQERFQGIAEVASISGFNTKRFFGTVMDVTTGMQLYNTRMAETAGLLLKVGKILGQKMGADFVKGIADMFKGDSIQERYKKVFLAGRSNVAQIFKRSAENTANDFLGKLGSKLSAKELKKAFTDVGASIDIPGLADLADPKKRAAASSKVVKALSKLSPDKQEELIARVASKNADMGRQLENLIDVSRGSTGKLSEMVTNLDSLDVGGKMAFALTQASSLFKKPIHRLSAIETAAFANASNLSMEQIKQLKRVSMRFHGNFRVLKRQAKLMEQLDARAKGGDVNAKAQLAQMKKTQVENAGNMGAMVKVNDDGTTKIVAATKDANGKVVATTDRGLKNVSEFVQTQEKAIKEAAKTAVPENIKLARQQISETTSLSKKFSMMLDFLQGRLYSVVRSIADYFGGFTEDNKKERDAMVKQFKGQEETLKKGLAIELENQASAKKTYDALKDPEQKKLIKIQMEETKKRIASLRSGIKMAEIGAQEAGQITKITPGLTLKKMVARKLGERAKDYLSPEQLQNVQGQVGARTGTKEYKAWLKKKVSESKFYSKTRDWVQRAAGIAGSGKAETISRETNFITAEVAGKQQKKTMEYYSKVVADNRKIEEQKSKKRSDQNKRDMDSKYPKVWATKYADELDKRQRATKMFDIARSMGKSIQEATRLGEVYADKKAVEPAFAAEMKKYQVQEAGGKKRSMWDVAGMLNTPILQDFLIRARDDGRFSLVAKFNPMDKLSVLGTKPGGGIGGAVGAVGGPGGTAAGAGGVRPIVNITINGNEERAYNVVKKALKTAGVTG